MRYFLICFATTLNLTLSAQDTQGEIESREMVIEKEKILVLPKANKIMLAIGNLSMARDTGEISFGNRISTYEIPVEEPQLRPKTLFRPQGYRQYDNYIKAGFGNFNAPLLTAYAGDRSANFNWGAWAYHESFGKGAVAGDASASGKTLLDFFGTYQTDAWAVTPGIRVQNDFYNFYGTNDLSNVPRADLNRYQFNAQVQRVKNDDWNLIFEPRYHYSEQRQEGEMINKENHFITKIEGAFDIDSTYSVTSEIQVGILDFTSGGQSQIRNYFMFTPRFNIRTGVWAIDAGLNIASTSDTVSSNGYFYPHVAVNWSGLEGWNVYGNVSGYFDPLTFDDVSAANGFLGDSLALLHEVVQSQLTAGIRGLITPKLFLNAGIQLASRENQGFYKPSASDTAVFIYRIDPGATASFSIFGELNWEPLPGTSIRADIRFNEYATDNEIEAWYLPALRFGMQWNQQYGEKISTDLQLLNLRGIKAPEPITEAVLNLDAILDIQVSATYHWSENFGLFLELDNLFGQEYERYLNYPNRGTSFKIGGIYRF